MQIVKTLYEQPIVSSDTAPPLTIQVVTQSRVELVGGAAGTGTKGSTYVLYDVLPEELKARVQTAIQTLQAGM